MRAFQNKRTGIITSLELKNFRIKILCWIIFATLLIVSCACLFPPLWILMSAFKSPQEFLQVPPSIFPKSFDIGKIVNIWGKMDFSRSYLNTLYMGLGELIFCLVINGLAGYVISRLKPKGTTLVFTILMWTMMLPGSVSMVPLFMSFIDFPVFHWNLTNTFWPMWLMAGANAFNVLLFKSFFDSIPMAYLEAARIDGCSNVGIFAKIIVPLSKPVVMAVSIFSLNGSWGSFFWPYLLIKNTNMEPIGLQIYRLKQTAGMDEYMMALLFVIIPPALIFIFFQKYIMDGFTLGGLKG